ncbi:hypothetical protein [Saccharothrix australiensis]|uniref:Uncharacterized protein n=1 Tax=Saccharothrix australiensis TaxID=2072 RepID=A0A495VIT2_9PSEU|nr:hypothetical protein [Saccharothrix australiensis]RKT49289.1 hypothetical protein C8E97_6785 [Saccharothrix australiensis]
MDRTRDRVDVMLSALVLHVPCLDDPRHCAECGAPVPDDDARRRHLLAAMLTTVVDSVAADWPAPVADAVAAARALDHPAVRTVLASHDAMREEVRVALIAYQALEDLHRQVVAEARLTRAVRDDAMDELARVRVRLRVLLGLDGDGLDVGAVTLPELLDRVAEHVTGGRGARPEDTR